MLKGLACGDGLSLFAWTIQAKNADSAADSAVSMMFDPSPHLNTFKTRWIFKTRSIGCGARDHLDAAPIECLDADRRSIALMPIDLEIALMGE